MRLSPPEAQLVTTQGISLLTTGNLLERSNEHYRSLTLCTIVIMPMLLEAPPFITSLTVYVFVPDWDNDKR
jgi:hypothetical protein